MGGGWLVNEEGIVGATIPKQEVGASSLDDLVEGWEAYQHEEDPHLP